MPFAMQVNMGMYKHISSSVKWEVFREVKDWSLTALNTLNAFRHLPCFTDVGIFE
jgi:hypothetical protein